MFFNPFDPSSSHCIQASVNNLNTPFFWNIFKVFFDYFILIATTKNEFVNVIVRKNLHNMPKNWLLSYFDHWFWFWFCFFNQSGSTTTCKYYCFQILITTHWILLVIIFIFIKAFVLAFLEKRICLCFLRRYLGLERTQRILFVIILKLGFSAILFS